MVPEIVVSIPVKQDVIHYVSNLTNEFRLDYYRGDFNIIAEKLKNTKRKIVTIRDWDEGGFYYGSPFEKIDILKKFENAIIDIEIKHAHLIDKELKRSRKLILSAHNFKASYEIKEIEQFLTYSDIGLIKIAMVMENAEKYIDVALENTGRLLLIDLSGNVGNRILFSLISNTFLYSYYDEKTAPGQIHYKKAMEILERIKS